MDALGFLEKHGKETAEAVAKKAGSNYAYFSQIAHGHRRPSVDLAHKLVAASEELIPAADERLDVLSLLQPKEKVA
jgi:transcriptional regulator with XRE-family HTH domain